MAIAHGGHDNNMRAAYVHVLADAATSVLAIVALACGYYFGLGILDPLAALVGAFVIASWAYGLIRDSAMVLLDADADPKLSGAIKSTIEQDLGARVADLHLWRLGPGHRGLIVSLVSPDPTTAEQIKASLAPALSRPVACDGRSRGLRGLRLVFVGERSEPTKAGTSSRAKREGGSRQNETKKPPAGERLFRIISRPVQVLGLLIGIRPSRCTRLRCSLR